MSIKELLEQQANAVSELGTVELGFYNEVEVCLDNFEKLKIAIDLSSTKIKLLLNSQVLDDYVLASIGLISGAFWASRSDDLALTWSRDDMAIVYLTIKTLCESLSAHVQQIHLSEQQHLAHWHEYLYGDAE